MDLLATISADEVLEMIREILWPVEEPERSWSPDTMEEIADVMVRSGRGPER
jgi:hypothetical protein